MSTKLNDYIIDIASGPFGSNLKVEEFVNDGFPIIDGANLKGTRVSDNITKFVTEEKARTLPRCIAKKGDVIVTISGTLGQIAYIPTNAKFDEYLVSQRQFRVTFDTKKVDVRYLVYYFHTKHGQKKILSFANYVGVPALSQPLPNFKNIDVDFPSIEKQKKIADIIDGIDIQIQRNQDMCHKLQVLGHTIYSDTFRDCKTTCSLMNFPYIHFIKQGIDVFKGKKHYIATADVVDDNLNFDASKITFDNREGRANMQPIKNSVWFAQMKNSVKHIFVSDNDDYLVDNYIFSTGFYGFQCDDIAYEFMVETISLPYFEKVKDKMANGAIMASINSDSLHLIEIPSPTIEQLSAYHERMKNIYMQISAIKTESHKLSKLKEKLLPLLINGQLSVK